MVVDEVVVEVFVVVDVSDIEVVDEVLLLLVEVCVLEELDDEFVELVDVYEVVVSVIEVVDEVHVLLLLVEVYVLELELVVFEVELELRVAVINRSKY